MSLSELCGQGGPLGGPASLDVGVLFADRSEERKERGINDFFVKVLQAFTHWSSQKLANLSLLFPRNFEDPYIRTTRRFIVVDGVEVCLQRLEGSQPHSGLIREVSKIQAQRGTRTGILYFP